MLIIPVHGTFTVPAKGTAWHMTNSDFHLAAQAAGLNDPWWDGAFEWSGDLDGALAGKRAHTDWEAAGKSLRYFLSPTPAALRNVVTHSHGLQVALYAAASGSRIENLVSITGPVRVDLLDVAKAARPNIGKWLHIWCPTDMVQFLGGCSLDMSFNWPKRVHPFADENLRIPKVGHSGLLSDPTKIPIAIQAITSWLGV